MTSTKSSKHSISRLKTLTPEKDLKKRDEVTSKVLTDFQPSSKPKILTKKQTKIGPQPPKFANQKRHDNISWDEYFMSIAILSGKRSKDPSRQVGACIVDQHKKIVSIGYNGMPNGCDDDDLPWDRVDTKFLKKQQNKFGKNSKYSQRYEVQKNSFDCQDCGENDENKENVYGVFQTPPKFQKPDKN